MVSPAKTTLNPGNKRNFSALAQVNYPSDSPSEHDLSLLIGTTWMIFGNSSESTVMNGGTLQVAAFISWIVLRGSRRTTHVQSETLRKIEDREQVRINALDNTIHERLRKVYIFTYFVRY